MPVQRVGLRNRHAFHAQTKRRGLPFELLRRQVTAQSPSRHEHSVVARPLGVRSLASALNWRGAPSPEPTTNNQVPMGARASCPPDRVRWSVEQRPARRQHRQNSEFSRHLLDFFRFRALIHTTTKNRCDALRINRDSGKVRICEQERYRDPESPNPWPARRRRDQE